MREGLDKVVERKTMGGQASVNVFSQADIPHVDTCLEIKLTYECTCNICYLSRRTFTVENRSLFVKPLHVKPPAYLRRRPDYRETRDTRHPNGTGDAVRENPQQPLFVQVCTL